jgi:hypothetical protein
LVDSWLKEAKKWIPHFAVADFVKTPTKRADVFVIQKSVLQRTTGTRDTLTSLRFKYLIVDECQTWVRGQPSHLSNQLHFYRTRLLPKADAVYLLSGTPFPGQMRFDFIETIKSLACSARREKWSIKFSNEDEPSFCYSDEALKALDEKWVETPMDKKAQMLVPILLRRTGTSLIDKEPVMVNYMAMLHEVDDGDILVKDIYEEMTVRNAILDRLFTEKRSSTDRYTLGRWLAWTSQVTKRDWSNSGRNNPRWWDNFTLEDASEFERGRRLVQILKR